MAKSADDAEFWLPLEFLSDNGVHMEKENYKNSAFRPASLSFPSDFPYEFELFGSKSVVNSPVDSAVSSTETESSDEEDFFAGLTQRLVQSSLYETQKPSVPTFNQNKYEQQQSRGMSGSPQSTLSGIGSWSFKSTVSSTGSPNGPSQAPSPPATPFCTENDTWNLIYAAAGQVARLKMSGEAAEYINSHNNPQSRLLMGSRGPTPVPFMKNPSSGVCSNQSLTRNLPQTAQFQQVRHEQVLKPVCSSACGRPMNCLTQQPQPQQIHSRGRIGGYEIDRCGRPLPQPAWTPRTQQQNQQPEHNGEAMRAALLGGSVSKKESVGTGVFLPRNYGNPPESRKKAGCPTVLLPQKVVQALEEMNSYGRPNLSAFRNGITADRDAFLAQRSAVLAQQQRRSLRPDGSIRHDIRLPQEWTY